MTDHRRAEKAAARERAAATGESHQQALTAIRREQSALYLVVDLPAPDLGGAEPCPACRGAGVSGELYEQPVDARTLLVEVVCPRCMGCGRAAHEDCRPGRHATDDPAEADDFDDVDDFGDLAEDGGAAGAEACPSCQGRRFNFLQAYGEPDTAAEQARQELDRRRQERGVDERQMAGAIVFGELDEVLGAGAQQLAEAADTTVWLRVACGCASGAARTVTGAELAEEAGR